MPGKIPTRNGCGRGGRCYPLPTAPAAVRNQSHSDSQHKLHFATHLHAKIARKVTQKTALAMVRSTRTPKLYESLARKNTCHATHNCALSHQPTLVRKKTRTDNSQSNVLPTSRSQAAVHQKHTHSHAYTQNASHANDAQTNHELAIVHCTKR